MDVRQRTKKVSAAPTNKPTKEKPKKSPQGRSCWFVCKVIFCFIFVTFLSVYCYNVKALASEAKFFRPPGEMIKLADGHSLYLNCKGNKDSIKPIVVLVMGFITPEVAWYPFQAKLAEEGWRVCTYDRSGIGWSEPSPDRFVTVQGFVDELHELIQTSGISKHPQGYTLVGMSMGAAITARYIEQWPQETKGGYMIDPPVDGIDKTDITNPFQRFRSSITVLGFLAELGLFRPLWYFGKLHPLGTFLESVPSNIADGYLYLAARRNGYYAGLVHEMGVLDPGHGYFSNTSTWEFILKYNDIPLHVELRNASFMQEFDPIFNVHWIETRKALQSILAHKQQTFFEDHLGRTSSSEPLSNLFPRSYDRIKTFLTPIK